MPCGEVARPVVEEHNDPPGIPWENIVKGGVFDDVQIAVAVHVVDLARGAECAVQQVSSPCRALVGEVTRAVVDEEEVFGRASSAVDSVVDEVQILCAIAGQIPRPHRTNQRLVTHQFRQARLRIVFQSKPVAIGVFALVHVEHGLLVEGVDDDHVLPVVTVDVHHVDVSREAGIGNEFWSKRGGHVDQDALHVDQEQIGFGWLGGGGEGLFANHNDVHPPVLVQVCRPDVFFFIVGVGDAR